MKRAPLRLQLVLTLFLFLGDVSVAVSAQEVVADYSWAREHYADCAGLLLGSHVDLAENPFASTVVVTVRALADDCPERQVSLVAKTDGELKVHAARVKGEALLEQLFTLHEQHPTVDAADLCREVPVESQTAEAAQIEKLRRSLEELQESQFSLLPEHLAVVHGTHYSIWITSGQWTVHVTFSDVTGSETRHPLASWSEEVLAAAGCPCPPDNAENAESN